MTKKLDDQYYTLLLELQQLDFVIVELNLYLDTHPSDMDALKQFNRFAKARKQKAHEFEAAYGPLMHFGHSFSRHPWQWNETPWPWQV